MDIDEPIGVEDELQGDSKPPYISYLTWSNCIEWFRTTGIPARFDRSIWGQKYSGSMGPQLVNAMRFLGLLDGETPTPQLVKIVKAEGDDRKKVIEETLKSAYALVPFDQIPTATPGMFADWMRLYGLSGSSIDKTRSFLVNALKDIDYPLLPHVKKLARNRSGSSKKSPAKPRASSDGGSKGATGARTNRSKVTAPPPPVATGGYVKEVELASGGKITLGVSVDPFALSKEERDFVNDLIDKINEFGGKR
jgi:hypothetical protein